MLDDIEMRAVGQQSKQIRAFMAQRAETFARGLLLRGIDAWAKEQFHRFESDDENSCSVRIYDLCDEILRAEEESWPQVQIRYEGFLPTPEMRKGRVSASGAPRPDLFVYVGSADLLVEAKRLHPSGPLPRLYVVEGMQRFIKGRYPVGSGKPAIMLGYLMSGSDSEVLEAVNAAIGRIDWLSVDDRISHAVNVDEWTVELSSTHENDLRMVHLWVDVASSSS